MKNHSKLLGFLNVVITLLVSPAFAAIGALPFLVTYYFSATSHALVNTLMFLFVPVSILFAFLCFKTLSSEKKTVTQTEEFMPRLPWYVPAGFAIYVGVNTVADIMYELASYALPLTICLGIFCGVITFSALSFHTPDRPQIIFASLEPYAHEDIGHLIGICLAITMAFCISLICANGLKKRIKASVIK